MTSVGISAGYRGGILPNDYQDVEELERHFYRELAELRKDEDSIDDIAAAPLLDAWSSCLEWARRAKLNDRQIGYVASAARSAAQSYETYQQTHGAPKRAALRSMGGDLHIFETLLQELESNGFEHLDVPMLRRKITRAVDAFELAQSVMIFVTTRFEKLEQAVAAAEASAKKAEDSVALAEQAATKSATSRLEQSFSSTASTSSKIAWTFRVLTILLLAFTIILGWTFAVDHAPGEGEAVDWYGIVYRLAILSGLGALAAYLGRQAGNYTRLTTWAHSIQIQLKAFRGFVNEIEDQEARQTMFFLFGKRVLESPPDGKSAADDGPTNLIQPIFEAAKLRPPQ